MGKIFGLTQTNQNIHYFLNRFYSDIKIITVCSQQHSAPSLDGVKFLN